MKRTLLSYLPFASLLIMLLVTLLVYLETGRRARERQQKLFELRVEQVQAAVERRMQHYLQVLRGARGLMLTKPDLNRTDWQRFVRALEVERNFPGIQGTGFAEAVPAALLPAFEARVRAEGFPDFQVKPAGSRPLSAPILYIEPFQGRNLRAFGFDMYSEPTRQAALQRALETGLPALSGKVVLMQEMPGRTQPGFLMYLPVYRSDTVPPSVAERRRQLRGWVYTPFRSYDLMNAILRPHLSDLEVALFEGERPVPAALLYLSDTLQQATAITTGATAAPLTIAGYRWTLYVRPKPGAASDAGQRLAYFILSGGVIISLLLFGITRALLRYRRLTELHQTLTDNATAALFMKDSRGYCTFMNPAAEALTGYTLQEIRQQPLHEMIHHHHPDGRPYPLADCPLDGPLAAGRPLRGHEDFFIRKDGTFLPVSCTVQPLLADNSVTGTLLEVRDLTQIREAERKAQNNEKLLQQVFRQVPAIVGLLQGPDMRYVLANGRLRRLLQNRAIEGVRGAEVHAEHADTGLIEAARQVFATGEAYVGKEVPVRGQVQAGEPARTGYFNIVFEPLKDPAGQVDYVLIFAVDVTALVLGRQQLQTVNQTLKEKNEALLRTNTDLDNFVYTASHDLKLPLTNLEGLTQALEESVSATASADTRQLLHHMRTSVQKLRQTILDLTEITKVQKLLDEKVEPLRFDEVLADILTDLAPLISDTQASVTTRFEVPEIRYARRNLRSILYNLVSNAIRYRHPDRPPQVQLRTYLHDSHLMLEVTDNGLGLKDTQLPRLFSMFTRMHTHVEGSGIGLYIVKRIIENFGGSIKVRSRLGEGSTFTICFH